MIGTRGVRLLIEELLNLIEEKWHRCGFIGAGEDRDLLCPQVAMEFPVAISTQDVAFFDFSQDASFAHRAPGGFV